MRSTQSIARAFAAALLLCASAGPALADDGTTPPGGITPAGSMTLTRLLTLHRVAVGKLDAGVAKTVTETDAYREGNLTGTIAIYESGDDDRTDVTVGTFHSAYGTLGGKAWEQNRNGLTRTMTGVHDRGEINARALRHAAEGFASHVALLGRVKDPVSAYVVRIDPPGGRVEYRFYDTSTYLLVRDEEASEGKRITYTYDDFRTTKGIRLPWHTHRTNGVADNDMDWKITALSYGDKIDPANVAIPSSASTLSFSGDKTAIPAKLSGDRIILTIQLGGHKVNMQMDSGASGILLNRAVADATGVKSFGSRTAETAGKYLSSDALIPKIGFGDATMLNVSAETAPYVASTYDGAPVAGLMGYDFIAGAVMHIDYLGGTVEAIAPAAFKAPAGAIALPIRLDDGVPIVEAKIGSATGHHFIVDTGADRSMIFSGFAKAHPADVADQGLGDSMTAAYPYIDQIYGVGGKVEVRPVQVSSLTVGSITLPKWLFDVSQDAPSFEGDDYDGLIGQDVLRNFDVYFDYAHTTMYLVPNDRYKQRWG
ncbi:MAG TPA: aspartyl protease family protein [Candidatus Baltobacteraceae bacterium]|nr:aspartyl protease family protein [Candidatus Baltobacteraceae bacterium]